MASLGSSIRSAARATFSAYRTVPIRWRLAGGSAALTFVILAGFAGIVGVLTDRQVTHQFVEQMQLASSQLAVELKPKAIHGTVRCNQRVLSDFAGADNAQIRVFDVVGDVVCAQGDEITAAQMQRLRPQFSLPTGPGSYDEGGYRVQAQKISWSVGDGLLIYARPLSTLEQTIEKVRVFLVLGVLGGTMLALLAGLATAQRAVRPIAQLTDAAREIERTRDPSRHIPRPTTRWPSSRGRSRGCSARSTPPAGKPRLPSPASASSSRTPHMSCARR
jgi:two-component system OmpR family sensor kinase